MNIAVRCPLCGGRKARRRCPALRQDICSVCCATKRLVEIDCPSDCGYLAAAREHPAAVVVRQQQRDVGLFLPLVRDFNERQSELFVVVATLLRSYRTSELETLIDDDAAEAMAALAATYETSARGVIYEHRPSSAPASRLMTALKTALAGEDGRRSASFERDAAVVLRRLESAVAEARAQYPGERRAFIDLLGRLFTREPAQAAAAEPSRLIVP
jgi:hypothetical protein